ncbi:MAG: hypothetical protein Q7S28_01510 [bacterium]|nr:hypothetical protein [bacterium]
MPIKNAPRKIKKAPVKKRSSREKKVSTAKKPVRRTRVVRGKKAAPRSRSTAKHSALRLAKFHRNPIIAPSDHPWESRATFNPGALEKDGRVHLLYRAIGDRDISVLGYAASADGLHVDKQLDAPAYSPTEIFEGTAKQKAAGSWATYNSGGGTYGGCEDPRLVKIGDRIYLTYTAYDGWSAPRVAISSISEEDFLKHKWSWESPVIISPPNEAHKNWVLFPEKINGKYAILHSLCPRILIEYLDDLDFDGKTYIRSVYGGAPQKNRWDSRTRGAGPPPIKTEDGWLVLYHAIDDRDPGKYKLGAMLLDLNDPTRIIYRASQPLLEPDQHYENSGFKAGVVYSCGAVIKDAELLVYYGGSDSVVCVATANLRTFLDELKRSGTPEIHPQNFPQLKK